MDEGAECQAVFETVRVCVCVWEGGGCERVGQQVSFNHSTHFLKSVSSSLPSKPNRTQNVI